MVHEGNEALEEVQMSRMNETEINEQYAATYMLTGAAPEMMGWDLSEIWLKAENVVAKGIRDTGWHVQENGHPDYYELYFWAPCYKRMPEYGDGLQSVRCDFSDAALLAAYEAIARFISKKGV